MKVAEEAVDSVVEFNKWNSVREGDFLDNSIADSSRKDAHTIHADASISEEGFVTLGCIIKDQHQSISIVACKKEYISAEVAVTEALAIPWGLNLAKDLQLERIVIKSDAKVVMDCVNFVQTMPVLDPVVLDIRTLLSSFNFFSLLFRSRTCNVQAHNLAILAFVVGSRT